MPSLGQHLRELRARRNLSLEDVARTTRVASRYLEALEGDDLAALPAPAFTRGFIRAYCQVFSEPPDQALALYEQSASARPSASPVMSRPVSGPLMAGEPDVARSPSAVLVSFILLVVLGMALFAVTLMLHPGREERERRVADTQSDASPAAEPIPEVPSPPPPAPAVAKPPAPPPVVTKAPAVPPSASNTATLTAATSSPPTSIAPTPSAPAPTPAGPTAPAPAAPAATASVATAPAPSATVPKSATPAPSAGAPAAGVSPALAELPSVVGAITSPYRLIARTSEATWIRVRMADGRITEETVEAGQVREWVSNEPFVLTIGNAGGVTLELNGQPLPSLGSSGAVTRLVLPPER